jgi:acetylornithine deacetylase/succinyl-diaminopimelate desuccinylase-like protein
MDDTLTQVQARVAERFPADLERIRAYLRMPSVSATGEGIGAVAEATGAWIEGAGGSFELQPTPGHPVVIGELPGVGPAVVARGAANSKGCLACFFLAVEVLRGLDAMPLTVALMIEGEEELGSPNLAAAVRARAGDLTAEGAFDLDLTAGLDGQPELILGCKGLCDLELACQAGDWGGPAADLHSSEQAWIASPVWALVQALATLTGPDEEIRVAGLDGGPGPGEDDRRLLAELAAGAVRRHLDERGFGHVQVRLLDAYPWAKAPPGNRFEAAMRASYAALGRRTLPYPLAPWCAPYFVFDRTLGLPWASGGVGHAAGAHGPDEYATLAGLQEHIVGAAAFLLAYADLPG